MLLGYARVSTQDQKLDLQIDALKKAGVEEENIYTDKCSGIKSTRPGYLELYSKLRKGDTIVVYSMSRFSRSMKELVNQVDDLRTRGVEFKSLTEGIDTSTPTGRLTYHIFAAIASFERELISERTIAGVKAARAKGRKGGRQPKLLPNKIKELKRDYESRNYSITDLSLRYKISPATIYRYLG